MQIKNFLTYCEWNEADIPNVWEGVPTGRWSIWRSTTKFLPRFNGLITLLVPKLPKANDEEFVSVSGYFMTIYQHVWSCTTRMVLLWIICLERWETGYSLYSPGKSEL